MSITYNNYNVYNNNYSINIDSISKKDEIFSKTPRKVKSDEVSRSPNGLPGG